MKHSVILLFSVLTFLGTLSPLSAEAPADSGIPLESRLNRVPDEKTGKALLTEIDTAFHQGQITPKQKDLWSGIVCHNLANINAEVWLDEALARLEPLAAEDPLAMAYYGSALTIRGGVKSADKDILGASMDVDAGFKWIDKAVKAAPDDLTIRILRISNGLSVSAASPFKRHDIIRVDLDWMKARYGSFTPDLKACYHWAEGELALQLSDGGKAVSQFRKAVAADPKGDYGRQAARSLAELED